MFAADLRVGDYDADSAGWLSPQDLVISMLQLLFLITQQLTSRHRYAVSPLRLSKPFLERAASLLAIGLPQGTADEVIRGQLSTSGKIQAIVATQAQREEQETDMRLPLYRPTGAMPWSLRATRFA